MGPPRSAQVDDADPAKARIDRAKLAMTLSIAVIVAAMLWSAQRFPERVALFPTVITSIVLLLALADLVRILRPARFGSAEVPEEQVVVDQGDRRTSGAAAVGWLLLLVAATVLVGFLITVPLYMTLFLRLHGRVSWRATAVSVVSVWLVIYLVFVELLNLPVYEGWLL